MSGVFAKAVGAGDEELLYRIDYRPRMDVAVEVTKRGAKVVNKDEVTFLSPKDLGVEPPTHVIAASELATRALKRFGINKL